MPSSGAGQRVRGVTVFPVEIIYTFSLSFGILARCFGRCLFSFFSRYDHIQIRILLLDMEGSFSRPVTKPTLTCLWLKRKPWIYQNSYTAVVWPQLQNTSSDLTNRAPPFFKHAISEVPICIHLRLCPHGRLSS